jgi:hypothetical protein
VSRYKIREIFEKHIKGTAAYAIVMNETVLAGVLPAALAEMMGMKSQKVYIACRVIKHLYDKKPAEEFDYILANLHEIIGQPTEVYRNKSGKTGIFCIARVIKGERYLCSLDAEGCVVTAFRIRDDHYLIDYDLLRSWRDGDHSS